TLTKNNIGGYKGRKLTQRGEDDTAEKCILSAGRLSRKSALFLPERTPLLFGFRPLTVDKES
ncbi:TPA: hypothetical protein ACWYJ7_003517, partial [Klebsiella pneumoniae]